MFNPQKTVSNIIKETKYYIKKNGIDRLIISRPYNLNSIIMNKMCEQISKNILKKDIYNTLSEREEIMMCHLTMAIEAKQNDLIIGNLDLTDIFSLSYYKHAEENVDALLLGGLFKSEVQKLAEYLNIDDVKIPEVNRHGIRIGDVEWAYKENEKHNIFGIGDVKKHPKWFTYVHQQKQVLSYLNERFASHKHKTIPNSVFIPTKGN